MRTLYRNGSIWTLDSGAPQTEAFVVEAGRFLAVGAASDCEPLCGVGTRVVDLGGRLVIPGLIDAHVHFSWFSFGLVMVSLEGITSLAIALERLRDHALTTPKGSWIRAHGFDPNVWERWPTRYDLDAVLPDHPVLVNSKDCHSLWVNSLALTVSGITSNTVNPAGGQIWRDQHGVPTGILQETATDLVTGMLPPPTHEEYVAALRLGLRQAASVGVTSAHDMDPADCFRALQTLHGRGELSVRFFKQIPESIFESVIASGLMTGYGNEWLRVGCLKLFSDGALGSQTAHTLDPYVGRPDYRGLPTHTPQELNALVARAVQHDVAVAIHAIGDAANRHVLDAFEHVAAESRRRGLRHRIEHAQLLTDEDLPRFAALDLIASIQPSHAPSDRYLAEQHWGDRSRLAYAFRSLKSAGARLVMGSDVPVEPLDPLAGIHAAVWRKRMSEPDSAPWHPEQRLTVEEAVRGFTLDAAYASGEEHLKGSIQPGKLADFVVLTHDIRMGDEESLRTVRPQATYVGGNLVFGEP